MGPVSGTGRAMMASLQQAMQQGMPVDQAIAYVKGMAQQGVAPLVDLYAMLNQFQRLQQPQAQAPQTPPTVRDQINMAAQQQSKQQAMTQGLGSMNAGSMENPSFAGGGIIAFQDGGTADSGGFWSRLASGLAAAGGASPTAVGAVARGPERRLGGLAQALEGVPDEELESALTNAVMTGDQRAASDLSVVLRQRGRKDLIDRATKQKETQATQLRAAELGFGRSNVPAAPPAPPPPAPRREMAVAAPAVAAPPAQESVEQRIAEAEKGADAIQRWRQSKGLGKAREEMRTFLSDEEKRLEKQYGEDRRLAFAEMGFRIAQAGSQPGATFLGALSEGAISGTQAIRGINKEIAENRRLLRQSMLKLKEAEELEKEGDFKTAYNMRADAEKSAMDLWYKQQTLENDAAKIRQQAEANRVQAETNQDYRSQSLLQQKYALKERILLSGPYPQLQLGLQSADPEQKAAIQQQMAALERDAERRAGLGEIAGMRPEDVTAPSDAVARLQRMASERGLNLVPANQ